MSKKGFKGILLLLMVLTMTLFAVGVASAASNTALLVQDHYPWGSDANNVVLDNLGYDYTVTSMADIDSINLSDYKLVILANDQSSYFADGYATNQAKFEAYIKKGGVLLFGDCYQSSEPMPNAPGGVEHYFYGENYNYIVDFSNPIVTGELTDNVALTDSDLYGTWCSHVAFVEDTLPDGATIILRGSSSDDPTLVMYKFGKGKVVASGLTWEFGWENGYYYGTKALDDLFAYAMSLGKYVSSGHDSLPGHVSFSSHTGFEH